MLMQTVTGLKRRRLFSRSVAATRVATLPADDFPMLVEFEMTTILQFLFDHLPSAANTGLYGGKTQPKS
jgi:hypothetical protein